MTNRSLENFSGIFEIMDNISNIESGIEGVCSSYAIQFKAPSALAGDECNRRNILILIFYKPKC
jgi:hypothetical protein